MDGQRQERAERAIESQPFERLLLEQTPDQQEEDQAGERVEEAWPPPRGDVREAAPEQHRQPDRDRHLDADRPGPHGAPADSEVVSRAEQQHRQGQRDIEPSNSDWKPSPSGRPLAYRGMLNSIMLPNAKPATPSCV